MTVTQFCNGNRHAEHKDLPYLTLHTLEQEILKDKKYLVISKEVIDQNSLNMQPGSSFYTVLSLILFQL
jgi:hypothetical protein